MNRMLRWLPIVVLPLGTALFFRESIAQCWYFSDDFYWLAFGQKSHLEPVALFSHRLFNYYRPVINSVFYFDGFLPLPDASIRHLHNLYLHILSGGLLGIWLSRLTRNIAAVAVGMLVFLMGPVPFESVIWISGRTDLMAAFFMLLTLAVIPDTQKPGLRNLPAILTLILACFSKETAVLTPIAIFLMDWIQTKQTGNSTEKIAVKIWIKQRKYYLFSAFIALFIHAMVQLTGSVTFTELDRSVSLKTWSLNMLSGFSLAIIQFLPSFMNTWFIALLILLLATIIVSFTWRKGNPLIAAGFVLFFAYMIPAAAVPFPIFPDTPLTFGRFLYIPIIGMSLFFTGLSDAIWGRCLVCMYRPAIVILLMLLLVRTGLNGSMQTIQQWQTLTRARYTTISHIQQTLSVISPDKKVIIISPDKQIWPQMFQLFAGRLVETVSSPAGLAVSDAEVYLFNGATGQFVPVTRKGEP